MRLQVKHRVSTQFHLSLKHFVRSCVLIIARIGATHMQPEVHLLVLPQMHHQVCSIYAIIFDISYIWGSCL